MGFRFRRSFKILPGLRLNLGKKSASVSVGVRGAHVTLRPGHKPRTTVGLPGTGLSYTEGGQQLPASEPEPRGIHWGNIVFAVLIVALFVLLVVRVTR
jgi:hypothetical protein